MPKKPTPAETKYRKILEQSQGPQSLAGLARRYGVKRSTLVWWQSELRRRERARAKSAVPKLIPVKLDASAGKGAGQSAGFDVLTRSGRVVRVPLGFDAAELGRLLPVVEQSAC